MKTKALSSVKITVTLSLTTPVRAELLLSQPRSFLEAMVATYSSTKSARFASRTLLMENRSRCCQFAAIPSTETASNSGSSDSSAAPTVTKRSDLRMLMLLIKSLNQTQLLSTKSHLLKLKIPTKSMIYLGTC